MTAQEERNEKGDLLQALGIETTRLSSLDTNIFAIKGWTLTLVSAFAGVYLETGHRYLLAIPCVSVSLFPTLDCYFRLIQLGHRDTCNEIKKLLKGEGTFEDGNIWNNVWPEKVMSKRVTFDQLLRDFGYTFSYYGFMIIALILAFVISPLTD